MKKIAILIFLFIVLPFMIQAQSDMVGHVKVIQDQLVDTLLARYDLLHRQYLENPDNKGITGYRVQIFFDSGNYSGDRAREAQEEFQEKYEDIPVYISWKAPNYRVRAGDFRSRLEAERFLQQIKRDYPNAWAIKDKINFPELN